MEQGKEDKIIYAILGLGAIYMAWQLIFRSKKIVIEKSVEVQDDTEN